MSYCKSCGAYIPMGESTCPACGYNEKEQASAASATATQSAKAEEKKHRFTSNTESNTAQKQGEYHYSYTDNAKKKAEPKEKAQPRSYAEEYESDAEENKDLGTLCYLGPLLLIPLLAKPDSQFLRYHCNQGLLLLILCILTNVCFSIPVIGWIAGIMGWFTCISGFFKGLKNVREGKRKPLPYFGNITLIK